MGTKQLPIGILDSGLGGLALAKSIKNRLPNEQIIYFGDTVNSPNGDRSKDAIKRSSLKTVDFLMAQPCKAIIIACHTISSTIFNEVMEIAGDKVLLFNAIDPVIEHIASSEYKNIGIIGTRSTIESAVYDNKIKKHNKGIIVSSLATPLLAPMIEEGHVYDEIGHNIIKFYLSRHDLRDIEALILGCTHYHAIKNQLNKFYNFDVDLIDGIKILTDNIADTLKNNGLLNDSMEKKSHRYFVTDLTPHYRVLAKMFFEEEIELELINL